MIELYSASWCGPCKQLKKYLKENEIGFVEYDLDNNGELFAEKEIKGVPAAIINGEVFVGAQKIIQALE